MLGAREIFKVLIEAGAPGYHSETTALKKQS
jgi:isocitrate lyase